MVEKLSTKKLEIDIIAKKLSEKRLIDVRKIDPRSCPTLFEMRVRYQTKPAQTR
ncbi:UPF0316 protein bthur0004_30780 [Streptococcus suis]|nr:UPF0316 protein bthur0004_30780 [Streptococcus suis]